MECLANLLCIIKYAETNSGLSLVAKRGSSATAHQYRQLKEQKEEEFTTEKQGTFFPHPVRLNLRRKS